MLAANIKAEGQELPVTINGATGTVVDGWQRLRACQLIRRKSGRAGDRGQEPASLRDGGQRPSARHAGQERGPAVLAGDGPVRCPAERTPALERRAGRRPGRRSRRRRALVPATIDWVRQALKWDSENGVDTYEAAIRKGRMTAGRRTTRSWKWRPRTSRTAGDDDADGEGDSRDSRLDAIEQILRESGSREPLHYEEITTRALERGLIRTQGQNRRTRCSS